MGIKNFFVFPIFVIIFFLSSCASNEIRTYSNSDWEITLNQFGCTVNSVDVTNKSSEMSNINSFIYLTNRNVPNRTYGYYYVGSGCYNIAPSETRTCKTSPSTYITPAGAFAGAQNMGGMGCPDMSFSFR